VSRGEEGFTLDVEEEGEEEEDGRSLEGACFGTTGLQREEIDEAAILRERK
jgi:hypothetical protein